MAKGAMGHRLSQAICRPKSGTKLGRIPAIAKKLIIMTLASMSRSRRRAIFNATTAIVSTTAPKNRVPGVGRDKLTPEQAAGKLLAVATRIPQLTVLGIVGPGDALANPKTTYHAIDLRARVRHSIRAQSPSAATPRSRKNR